jgi:pyruvate-formate lyase-activating enzyme
VEYYAASGGGVTLSGGECLLQPEFVVAVCRGARALGVTAAIDTAGAGAPEIWDRVLPNVDCVLLCLKSAFVERYVAITGTNVEEYALSRRFLRACQSHGVSTWIRFVLMTNPTNDARFVPYATDSEEELVELARVAKMHSCVEGIELLPYHRLGVFKFQELGLEYKLEGMATPTREEIERAKSILIAQGVRVMC